MSELTIVGSNDLVPYSHPTARSLIDAVDTTARWRRINGCSGRRVTSQVGFVAETTWNRAEAAALLLSIRSGAARISVGALRGQPVPTGSSTLRRRSGASSRGIRRR